LRRQAAIGKEVKAMAGASRRWAAAAVAAVLLAGCASSDDKSAADRRPESEGFAWAGKGEQSNFGSDYNFCTRNTGGVGRSQATTRTVNDIAGNATNMGSSEAYGPMRQNATRGSYADKRGFWGCMESRGWQLVGGR
jgi:opacity protein-like surface antigen